MDASTNDSTRPRTGPPRRLVLGTALALALAISLAPRTPVAEAQESAPKAKAEALAPGAPAAEAAGGDASGGAPAPKAAGASEHRSVAISIGIDTDGKSKAAEDGADGAAADAGKDAATGHRIITIRKNGKTVTVNGAPGEHEPRSFGEFVDKDPAIALMVVAIVAVVFLSPVLAIALVLGYRMRKVRLQNETMLKLAERGVVTPNDAIAAVAAGALPSDVAFDGAAAAGPAASPAERVDAIRRRAAWSDLRKGVVIGAVGLGLTLFSLLDDGSANSVGLVLLFLGIGYGVLWWFEERQVGRSSRTGGTSAGTGPGGAS